jgi:hypothetical protein
MSDLLINGVAGTFGLAMLLFLATSVVAAPVMLYDEVRGRRRRVRR